MTTVVATGWSAALLPPLGAQDDPVYALQWQFTPGDQFDVLVSERTAVTSVYFPLSSRQDTELQLRMSWRVVERGDGAARLEQIIDSLRMSLSTPTEDGSNRIEIDTAREQALRGTAGALRSQLMALVGVMVVVEMKSDGSIGQVTIPDETAEALRNAPSATVLREMFSADGIRQLFEQGALTFPAHPVPAGHTWQSLSAPTEAWPGARIERQFEVRGGETVNERELARVEIRCALAAPEAATADPPSEAAGAAAQSKIASLSGGGWVRFDTQRGHVVESELRLELTTLSPMREGQIETVIDKTSRMEITRR